MNQISKLLLILSHVGDADALGPRHWPPSPVRQLQARPQIQQLSAADVRDEHRLWLSAVCQPIRDEGFRLRERRCAVLEDDRRYHRPVWTMMMMMLCYHGYNMMLCIPNVQYQIYYYIVCEFLTQILCQSCIPNQFFMFYIVFNFTNQSPNNFLFYQDAYFIYEFLILPRSKPARILILIRDL